MQSTKKSGARYLMHITAAVGLAGAASSAFAAPGPAAADAQAHEAWKESITQSQTPSKGCFHAVYPATQWVQDPCLQTPHRHMALPRNFNAQAGVSQTVGNGDDDVLKAAGTISKIVGSFPAVTGVTFEKGVGVTAFGSGGILGKNEYTLQVNSGLDMPTAACKKHTGCVVFQQFVYAPDFEVKGTAAVFIEYWLIGWGTSKCPINFDSDDAGDCVGNSDYAGAPDEPITQLANEKLSASAIVAGNDTVVFTDGTTAYSLTAEDSVLDLATVWNIAEFNVFGNSGGSMADFNKGSSVTVKIAATDGSRTAPTCVRENGSTGETNNLTLSTVCNATGGATPSIGFTESN